MNRRRNSHRDNYNSRPRHRNSRGGGPPRRRHFQNDGPGYQRRPNSNRGSSSGARLVQFQGFFHT